MSWSMPWSKNKKESDTSPEVTITIQHSRVTENRNGDITTDTVFKEIKFKGSGDDCTAIAYAYSNQAEQKLLAEKPEAPVRYIRPVRVVNE
ncbi:hypothetical protein [Tolypothrix sp. VBCCA 56010]|uniref:hypothetical protein n=1 Tax=Tolypothrix sp. VBCCA 56010 TaxID=3137731 RepID=UPI003D7E222C